MRVREKGSAAALDGDPFAADGGMAARLDAAAGDLTRLDFAERDRLGEVPRLAVGARHHLAAPRPAYEALVDAIVAVVFDDENAGFRAGRTAPRQARSAAARRIRIGPSV